MLLELHIYNLVGIWHHYLFISLDFVLKHLLMYIYDQGGGRCFLLTIDQCTSLAYAQERGFWSLVEWLSLEKVTLSLVAFATCVLDLIYDKCGHLVPLVCFHGFFSHPPTHLLQICQVQVQQRNWWIKDHVITRAWVSGDLQASNDLKRCPHLLVGNASHGFLTSFPPGNNFVCCIEGHFWNAPTCWGWLVRKHMELLPRRQCNFPTLCGAFSTQFSVYSFLLCGPNMYGAGNGEVQLCAIMI